MKDSTFDFDLTICVPSNRTLAECGPSLKSIMEFARSREIQLVISDNSLDEHKEEFLISFDYEHLTYVKGPCTGAENWYHAICQSTGRYSAFVSDDDFLFALPGSPIVGESPGTVGFRPEVVVYSPRNGIMRSNNFGISGETPKQRVQEYFKHNGGANSTLFSFWDSSELSRTMLLQLSHPFNVGYHDWAIVLSLVALGKVERKIDTLLLYSASNWEDSSSARSSISSMFSKFDGVKPFSRFLLLLLGLDAFIFIMRSSAALSPSERRDAAIFCLGQYLSSYRASVLKNPHAFTDADRSFISNLPETIALQLFFDRLAEYLEVVYPNLRADYFRFWEKSIERDWGTF